MKNILLISYLFPPKSGVGSIRPFYFAKYLKEFGNHVYVLTPYNKTAKLNHSQYFAYELSKLDIVYSGYTDWMDHLKGKLNMIGSKGGHVSQPVLHDCREVRKSGLFYSIKDYMYRQLNFPDETIGWYNYGVKKAFEIVEKFNIDVIVSSSPPETGHLIARRIKAEHPEIRWIADFRDLWSNDHYRKHGFPKRHLLKIMEDFVLEKADVITTISDTWHKGFRPEFHDKIVTIENGFEKKLYENVTREKGRKIRIFYGGKLSSVNQDIVMFLESFSKFINSNPAYESNILFRFLLDGFDKPDFNALFKKHSINCEIEFISPVSYDHFPEVLCNNDLLLFFGWKGKSREGWLSAKIYDYIGSGLPVIGFLDNDNHELIELFKKFDNFFSVYSVCDGFKTFHELIVHSKYEDNIKKKYSFPQNLYTREKLAGKLLLQLNE